MNGIFIYLLSQVFLCVNNQCWFAFCLPVHHGQNVHVSNFWDTVSVFMVVAPIKSKPHDAFDDAILLCMWHALGLSVHGPKAHWKHVAEFCMFCIGEGIAGGKRMVQAADESGQTGNMVNWKKVKQNGRLFSSSESSVLSFDSCYVNSKHTLTAAGRNSLCSLSECDSITTQDTMYLSGVK